VSRALTDGDIISLGPSGIDAFLFADLRNLTNVFNDHLRSGHL
jgi:hypothetical protein